MCFGTRKTGANFDIDDAKPKKKASKKSAPPPAVPKPAAPKKEEETKIAAVQSPGPKVAIVIYSTYGHIATLAEEVKKGIEEAGGSASLFQVPETLPGEVLTKMGAAEKPAYPVITAAQLATFDGYLMGIPTRFGTQPAQWRSFWDTTSGLWGSGALAGKYAGAFTSTAGLGGGQESTISSVLSTITHHGSIFVPLGYASAFPQLTNLSEVHGASPWGAGTVASADGSRQPSDLEKEIARIQGKSFWATMKKAF
ncbi:unnamed protein product [Mycena citricolor]|uniref:Flavodoxin-like domain-containing protein n=1 Tax=Mycena citricolor TaxID=2018698 RepID=A0AAD2HGH4_9AGAR|nr:unnamed protein product [Mycena citricolor]